MRRRCPACACEFPIEAGFADADGKRLAALFAELDPALGRSLVAYLRLFKPAKTALRTARALKIAQQLVDLVSAGTVCRDERGGVRRPASPATWAAAIEQMLQNRDKLVLPIENHNYLRAIAFGIVDSADAAAERKTEAQRRVGNRLPSPSANADPKREETAWLRTQLEYGAITQDEYDARVAELEGTP